MSLVRNIVSDVVSHKHTHFLTLGFSRSRTNAKLMCVSINRSR
jgi:hypothetical protein